MWDLIAYVDMVVSLFFHHGLLPWFFAGVPLGETKVSPASTFSGNFNHLHSVSSHNMCFSMELNVQWYSNNVIPLYNACLLFHQQSKQSAVFMYSPRTRSIDLHHVDVLQFSAAMGEFGRMHRYSQHTSADGVHGCRVLQQSQRREDDVCLLRESR